MYTQRWFGLLLVLVLSVLVLPLAAAQDTAVEVVGVIEAMDVTTITVNQQVIDVTIAELNTSLELGKSVKIHGFVLADGSLLAREIGEVTADDDDGGVLPGEVEVVGQVSSFDGTTLVIAGQTIDVSGAQVGQGVAVGAVVRAKVSFSAATNTWFAREVELVGGDDNDNANDNTDDNGNDDDDNGNTNDNSPDFAAGEYELIGTLTEIGDGFIVVAGQVINTTGAEINDQLVIGALVKIHLSIIDTVPTAREVELGSSGGNGNDDNGNNNDNGDDDDDNGNDNGGAVVIPPGCVALQPAGWTTYTIQGGDSLSSIASRSGSSVAELALTNCISDPRFIVAGMTLYVPRAVAPPTGNDNNNANDNGDDDDNGNDDNGNDDNSNDDNGNDDNGNDDNGNDDNGNDDNGGSNDNGDDDDNGGGSNNNDNGGDDDDNGGGNDSDD